MLLLWDSAPFRPGARILSACAIPAALARVRLQAGRCAIVAAIATLADGAALLEVRHSGGPPAPPVGMVRQTEIRIAPETTGRLASLGRHAGRRAREILVPGKPVPALEPGGAHWFGFTLCEDTLGPLDVGSDIVGRDRGGA